MSSTQNKVDSDPYARLIEDGFVAEEGTLDENDQPKEEPFKSLLTIPARAAWRVTSSKRPKALDAAQKKVLDEGGKTTKFLQRKFEEVIHSHQLLSGRRHRERIRVAKNRSYKRDDMKRDSSAKPVLYGPNETLAAFKFRLQPNYFVVRRILEEARSLLGQDRWAPRRVLDFGIGCGSSSAASLSVFDSIDWIHGIDPSQTIREGAKVFLDEFSERDDRTIVPRVTLSGHLSTESSVVSASFDLALFSYTACEIPHSDAILAAAALLWEKVRPNGLFVMVEPGTPDGFSSVRTVRNMLLDCCPPEPGTPGEEEFHVLAPCTHNGRCPLGQYQFMKQKQTRHNAQQDVTDVAREDNEVDDEEEKGDDLDDDGSRTDEEYDTEDEDEDSGADQKGYCSFVQQIPPGGSARVKKEKFSYIVAQKRVSGQPREEASPRFHSVRLPSLVERALDKNLEADHRIEIVDDAVELEKKFLDSDDDHLGLELVRGEGIRCEYGRIVLAPKKKKGHVIIDCCSSPGLIVRQRVPKSYDKMAPGIYSAARKSRWGGLWPVSSVK